MIKKLILTVAVLLVAIGGFTYYQLNAPLPDPKKLNQYEAYLWQQDPMAIAYWNQSRFNQWTLARFALDPKLLPGQSGDLINRLRAKGLNPSEQLEGVLLGLLPNKDQADSNVNKQSANWFIVAFGNFDSDALKRFFADDTESETITSNHFLIGKKHPQTCSVEPRYEVKVYSDVVLFTAPGLKLGNIDELKTSPNEKLSQWRQFRSNKLTAVQLHSPNTLQHAANDPFLKMMVAKQTKKLGPEQIEKIQLAIEPSIQDFGFVAELVVQAQPQWLEQEYQKLSSEFIQWKSQAIARLPSLLKLLDRITMELEQNRMTYRLSFDQSIADEIRAITEEFFNSLFSGSSVRVSGQGQNPVPEQELETKPLKFNHKYSESDIPAFNPEFESQFKQAATVGPFAARVEGIELNQDQSLMLKIHASLQNIKNIGSLNQNAKLKVIDVVDNTGQSLMLSYPCGAHKNETPADFQSFGTEQEHSVWNDKLNQFDRIPYTSLTARKSVELLPNTDLRDIAKVQVQALVDLPVEVLEQTWQSPIKNKEFEINGGRFYLAELNGPEVKFVLSGDQSAFLHLAALNNDGKPLARAGASHFGNNDRRSVTRRFRGNPTAIKLFVAKRIQTLNYQLDLDLKPRFAEDRMANEFIALEPVSEKTFREMLREDIKETVMDRVDLSKAILSTKQPLPLISLFSWSTTGFYGGTGEIRIHLPWLESLQENIGFAQLNLELLDENNNSLGEPKRMRIRFKREGRNSIWNGVIHYSEKVPYMTAMETIYVDKKDAVLADKLAGQVTFNLPNQLKRIELDALQMGTIYQDNDLQVELSRYNILGDSLNLIFKVRGNWAKLVQMNFKTQAGKNAAPILPTLSMGQEADQTLSYQVFGDVDTIELVLASEPENHAVPFEFKLPKTKQPAP